MTDPKNFSSPLFDGAFGAGYTVSAIMPEPLSFGDSIEGFVHAVALESPEQVVACAQSEIEAWTSDNDHAVPPTRALAEKSWDDPVSGLRFFASVITSDHGSVWRRVEVVGLDHDTHLEWLSDDAHAYDYRDEGRDRWFLWTASDRCRIALLFDRVYGMMIDVSTTGVQAFLVEPASAELGIDPLVFPPGPAELPTDEFDEDLVAEVGKMADSPSVIERLAAHAFADRLLSVNTESTPLRQWWSALQASQRGSWMHSTFSLVSLIEDTWTELIESAPDEGGESDNESSVDPALLLNARLARIATQRVWLDQLAWLFNDRDLSEVLYRLDETVDVSFYLLPHPVEPNVASEVMFQTFVLSALSGQPDPWWYLVHAVHGSEFDENER